MLRRFSVRPSPSHALAAGAPSVAGFAAGECFDRDRRLGSCKRLFERQFEVVAQVRSARGILTLPARIHELAEDRREDIGEAVEARTAAAERIAAVLESRLAEAVVGRALLRILEAFIGLADRLEARLLLGTAAVPVWMAFLGQPAIRRLDRGVVGAPV
jgi:hypothetical protein